MRRGRGGFTLIELMAVVAIFALLAAFVAPNLGVLSSRASSSRPSGSRRSSSWRASARS